MKTSQFKQLVKECIQEVNNEMEDPLYVEYQGQRSGETPFILNGQKYEYVNAKYPDGKLDIGVYAFAGDICYGYKAFRKMNGLQEEMSDDKLAMNAVNVREENKITEMTTTGAVAGFTGKNWVDPDPKRNKMKNITAKSIPGGEVVK